MFLRLCQTQYSRESINIVGVLDSCLVVIHLSFSDVFWHVDAIHAVGDIPPQGYQLLTVETDASHHLLVVGADDVSILYGAYALVEKFGVHFRLYG